MEIVLKSNFNIMNITMLSIQNIITEIYKIKTMAISKFQTPKNYLQDDVGVKLYIALITFLSIKMRRFCRNINHIAMFTVSIHNK